MFSEDDVTKIANKLIEKYGGEHEDKPDVIIAKLEQGNKKLFVDWPKMDLPEVWMTFSENNKDLYQEWFECFENEDKDEFINYIFSISERFFNCDVRVKKEGLIFKRNIFEYSEGNQWKDIFE